MTGSSGPAASGGCGAGTRRPWAWPTALAILCATPIALGWATASTLLVPLTGAALAYGLSRLEAEEGRVRFLELWAISMAVRWVALIAMVVAQRHVGAVLLGPDGALYLGRSVDLAAAGLALPESPISYYGTHDVGPYYLFASVIALFGDSLLTLQLVNATLSAFVAPLTYSWVRLLVPRHARVVGLVLALYPTATFLAVVDLLKDPAVTFATVLAVWAAVHLLHGTSHGTRLVTFAVAGTAALSFLHVTRFYTLFFLLAGVAGGIIWAVLSRRQLDVSARGLAAIAGAFLVAELAFLPLGWPLSADQMWQTSRNVLGTRVDSAPDEASGPPQREPRAVRASEERLPTLEGSLRFAQRATRPPTVLADPASDSDHGRGDVDGTARALRVETEEYRSLQPPAGFEGRVTSVVRKTLGPYVWILPPDYSVRTLLAGDYMLYPGMVVWYLLWPCMFVGLGYAAWQFGRGAAPFMIGALAFFTVAYLVLYLGVNLSYRQRDAVFPFLVVFAVIGVEQVRRQRLLLWAYGGYWLALVALASTHLVIRARLT